MSVVAASSAIVDELSDRRLKNIDIEGGK